MQPTLLWKKGNYQQKPIAKFKMGMGMDSQLTFFEQKKTLAVNGEWQKMIIDFLTLINEPGALPLALI
ncbi:MAG: hypothetical protein DRR19_15815 [Candidatus Parabeggiatoa sp. nov. 1]|nr:MAG: hypothetical protein DRR19_15815 [Gammaproteobacteria bacterium]